MHRSDQHTLAGLEAGEVLSDFDDLAGYVAAEDVGQFDSGQSLANPQVEMIHGTGADPDKHLIRAGLGVRQFFVAQDFWSAEFVDDGSLHQIPRSQAGLQDST